MSGVGKPTTTCDDHRAGSNLTYPTHQRHRELIVMQAGLAGNKKAERTPPYAALVLISFAVPPTFIPYCVQIEACMRYARMRLGDTLAWHLTVLANMYVVVYLDVVYATRWQVGVGRALHHRPSNRPRTVCVPPPSVCLLEQ